MTRRGPSLILLLVFAAFPTVAQQRPVFIGPVVGIMPAGDSVLMPVGLDFRYAILEWLSLRAELGYAMLFPAVEGYPEIACGAEINLSAGFYGKGMVETLLAIGQTQFLIPIVTAGLGFGMAGFFMDIDFNVLFAYGGIAPSLGLTLGYSFTL
jgi:hypothetical protein